MEGFEAFRKEIKKLGKPDFRFLHPQDLRRFNEQTHMEEVVVFKCYQWACDPLCPKAMTLVQQENYINPVTKSYNFVKSCQIIEAYFQLENEEHQRVRSKI